MALWVKICGMTHPEAVSAAIEAGADAIGFVFAASVRNVTPESARRLAQDARGRVQCIAVTQHPSIELVENILARFAPDILQTDAADLAALALAGRCATLPVMRVGQALPTSLPPRLLFEGPVSGTGRIADWSDAAALARRCELILAGGLSPANVAAAVATVRPFGVDVSSGVEESPGRKSPQKVFDFVRAARAAALETAR
jgi:phosphoribosylanthranilate isomerase